MEHIDEGTIHAWLDGALPANDATRLEAHIAACATCATAVAEARGLIAASSRILSALDDVPGGVIPVVSVGSSKGVATPTVADGPDAGRPGTRNSRPSGARRPWYQRPQWAAAAGVAFVMLASSVLLQRSGAPSIADSASEMDAVQRESMLQADSTATYSAASPLAESAPAPSAGAASANVAIPPAERAAAQNAAVARRDEARKEVARDAEDQRSTTPTIAEPKLAVRAPARATAERARSNEVERRLAKAAPTLVPNVAVPIPPPPVSPAAAPLRRAASPADSLGASKRLTVAMIDSISRAERERVAGERDAQVQSTVVTGAGGAMRQSAASTRPTPASVAGCYLLRAAAGAGPASAGDLRALRSVELEFSAAGSDDARPAYVAHDRDLPDSVAVPSDRVLRWTLSTSGQVILVRGEGNAARRIPMVMAGPVGEAPPADALVATRMECDRR